MTDLILTCPDCNGKYSGRRGVVGKNLTHTGTHSHTGSDEIDPRFADCVTCHGRGAMTCEKCGGNGRIILRDGVQVGTHAKPVTSSVLGPRKPK